LSSESIAKSKKFAPLFGTPGTDWLLKGGMVLYLWQSDALQQPFQNVHSLRLIPIKSGKDLVH
jgi:hypothetical protein